MNPSPPRAPMPAGCGRPLAPTLRGLFAATACFLLALPGAASDLGGWTTVAPMTTPRWGSSAGVINGVVYVAGGYNGSHRLTVDAYNPGTNTWSARSSLPGFQTNAAFGVIGGVLYVAGGTDSSFYISNVRAYDPVANAWTGKTSAPTLRQGAGGGVSNGLLYVVGGQGPGGSVGTLEVFNPVANSWTSKAAMPTARSGLGAGVINGVLYAVGGYNSVSGQTLATVEAYDIAGNTWTTKTSMPTSRQALSVRVVNGTLYAAGGTNAASSVNYDKVEAYDPVQDVWTTVAPLNVGAAALQAVDLNNVLQAFGGYLNGGTSAVATTEYFTPPLATGVADGIADRTATLHGTVNPAGSAATVAFEYGPTTAYGSSTTLQPVSGSSSLPVAATLSGLTPGSLYHFRLLGTFNGVTIRGLDQAFTTLLTGTVTLGSLSQTYDGTPRAATATTTPPGLAVTFTYNGSATAPANAGSYTVVGTINDPGYAGSATDTLVIHPATATVTLGSLSQTYDGTPRSITATTVPPGLSVTFTYNGSAMPPTNAGSYAVAGMVNDANYSGSALDTLVVSPAAASVTLGGLSQTYNGTPRSVTATTMPPGLSVNLTYNGSATPPTNAGSYSVSGIISDPNYSGGASNTLIVSKAAGTVTLGSLSQTFDGTPKNATATTVPAGLSVDFTYNGSSTAPTSVGSYAVVGTINDLNYAGSASGTLMINSAGPFNFGTWTAVAPMTTPRWGSSAGVINGVLYVAGGYNGSHQITVDAYTPNTNTWSAKAALPGVQTNAASGVIGGILYLAGGTNSSTYIPNVRAYDPVANAWTARTSAPTLRQGAGGGVSNGLLYVIGGRGSAGPVGTLEVFDPVANSWAAKASMPTARSGLGAGVVNGVLFAVGGINSVGQVLATVEAYDIASNTWTTRAPMPTSRQAVAVAVVNGTLYAVGGTNAASSVNYDKVEAYDPAQDKWTNVAPKLSGGAAVQAVDLKGFLHAFGGYVNGGASALAATEFHTPPVSTLVADGLSADSATLHGSVHPAGSAATVAFEYGLTTAYGNSTALQPVSGSSTLPIAAALSGLAPGTIYHFRLTGSFDGVTLRSQDLTFLTRQLATVTLGGLSQTYDGTPKSATATTSPAGLAVTFTYNGSAGAPVSVGSYTVVGTINDATYAGSATGLLQIVGAYTAWRNFYFGASANDPAISGNLVDFDGDGIPNLLEYALGGDPTTPSSGILPAAGIIANHFQFQFTRPAPAAVNYVVQVSADLASWSDVATLSVNGSTWTGPATVLETGSGPTRTVTVQDPIVVPLTTWRFFRVVVSP